MNMSNIVIGSNVFHITSDDPRHDPDFIRQIQDYDKLERIRQDRKADNRIAAEDEIQIKILQAGLRCIYAKDDPCWGYVSSLNRVTGACVNGECPRILNCNPDYTAEEADYWNRKSDENESYGDPQKLRRYYKVDMISEREMNRYLVDPANEGRNFPVARRPVEIGKQVVPKREKPVRYDPITGRKMELIRCDWRTTDNASYESEELVPIWGYVTDIPEKKFIPTRKTKKIQMKEDDEFQKQVGLNDTGVAKGTIQPNDNQVLKNTVTDKVKYHKKMTGISAVDLKSSQPVFLFDNPAEMAYVSSIFLKEDIIHGFDQESDIPFMLIDDFTYSKEPCFVMLSSTVLKKGITPESLNGWEGLRTADEICEIIIPEREYDVFTYAQGRSRWCCRNMYGITHVCMDIHDLTGIKELPDGEYYIVLKKEDDQYFISGTNGKILGKASEQFLGLIRAMIEADEIVDMPETIDGFMLRIKDNDIHIIGMGHLVFVEY